MLNASTPNTAPSGILGLNALDARNQHLLALDSPKNHISLPCGLPAELWNIIIDCLYDDKEALIACLLACRSWGDFCRYHVFETFAWSALDEFNPDPSDSETKPQLFHPCPHYVRHLAINGRFLDDDLPEDLDTEWLLPLAQRLDDFVSVVHLEVESVDWDDIFGTRAWETFCSSAQFLSQIKSLDYSNIPLQPFRYILDSICIFPALEKLEYLPSHVDFDDDEITEVDGDFLKSYSPSTSWHVFSTERAPLQLPTCGFWTWLSAVRFTSLQTIRLDSVPTSDLLSLSNYLRLLGESLKDFRIRFVTTDDIREFFHEQAYFDSTPPSTSKDDFAESGALTKSTGLVRLELIGLVRQSRNQNQHQHCTVADRDPKSTFWVGEESISLISTLPGGVKTTLTDLAIVIILDSGSGGFRRTATNIINNSSNRISALDDLLVSHTPTTMTRVPPTTITAISSTKLELEAKSTTLRFPSLKRVHITCNASDETQISNTFERCREKGLLRITTVSEPNYPMLRAMTELAYRDLE